MKYIKARNYNNQGKLSITYSEAKNLIKDLMMKRKNDDNCHIDVQGKFALVDFLDIYNGQKSH